MTRTQRKTKRRKFVLLAIKYRQSGRSVNHVLERRWNMTPEKAEKRLTIFSRYKANRPLCLEAKDTYAVLEEGRILRDAGEVVGTVDKATLLITWGMCKACMRQLGLWDDYVAQGGRSVQS